jgi:hypothetical protein
MTAINFPDSPTVGETFVSGTRAWLWDGTVWQIRKATDAYVSDTAPVNPVAGNTWFRSTTGQYFVYYDSTWVELGNGPRGEAGPTGVVTANSPLAYDSVNRSLSLNNYQPTLFSETAPSATVDGTRWYKTSTGQEYIYYNSSWIEV